MRQPQPDSLPTPPGWQRRHTGGGCWCFERDLGPGLFMQVFDAWGATLPTSDDDEILVAFNVDDPALAFKAGGPLKIRQFADLNPKCGFDRQDGTYFSWIVGRPDLDGGMGGWPHVFSILNTISRDALIYEIVLPQNRPEEQK